MPVPDGDETSEFLLLQKMVPTAGIFCLKEGDNHECMLQSVWGARKEIPPDAGRQYQPKGSGSEEGGP